MKSIRFSEVETPAEVVSALSIVGLFPQIRVSNRP